MMTIKQKREKRQQGKKYLNQRLFFEFGAFFLHFVEFVLALHGDGLQLRHKIFVLRKQRRLNMQSRKTKMSENRKTKRHIKILLKTMQNLVLLFEHVQVVAVLRVRRAGRRLQIGRLQLQLLLNRTIQKHIEKMQSQKTSKHILRRQGRAYVLLVSLFALKHFVFERVALRLNFDVRLVKLCSIHTNTHVNINQM
jgi:hypothetical protein